MPIMVFNVRVMRRSYRDWFAGLSVYERRRLIFVAGGAVAFYALLSYPEGAWEIGLLAAVGTILLGVAEHLAPRWRVGVVALRSVYSISMVAMTVHLLARLLS